MSAIAFRILAAAASLAIFGVQAQEAPAYKSESDVTGTVRIWGHPYMAGVVKQWAEGFARFHPEFRPTALEEV